MKKMIFPLVLCLGMRLFAAPAIVKLSGTVTETGGGALKDVTVYFTNASGISAITGSDGKFLLKAGGTPVLRMASTEVSPLKFHLKGPIFVLSTTSERISGTVDIFSATGKRTFSGSFANLEPPAQNAALRSFVPGINIVRMSVNGKTYTCPILRVGKNLYFRDASSSTTADGKFTPAKASAALAVDTLMAKKTGFTDKKTPITAYIDSNLAITMDSSGVCPPPKAGTGKSNPIFTDVYTADPACMVDNCTFYITCGHDQGTIIPKLPKAPGQDETTNHAGVAEFAGQWYIVYHVSNGPNGGGTYKREVAIDKLTFNNDGSIKPVTPSQALTL